MISPGSDKFYHAASGLSVFLHRHPAVLEAAATFHILLLMFVSDAGFSCFPYLLLISARYVSGMMHLACSHNPENEIDHELNLYCLACRRIINKPIRLNTKTKAA